MLSRKAIVEYQEIYKKEFGTEISYAEALEQGTKLLSLMRVIYRPIPTGEAETDRIGGNEYENHKTKTG